MEHSAETPVILAVGGHLKCSLALSVGDHTEVRFPATGLDTLEGERAFRAAVAELCDLGGCTPAIIAHDLHPDYRTTRIALEQAHPWSAATMAVQHHHAHIAACMAEHELDGEVLGVAFDGTGYGDDGTIWGGEFLRVTRTEYTRVAHLRPFRLPGGERAAREPRRCAIGLLHELFGPAWQGMVHVAAVRSYPPEQRAALATMLERGVNSPWCSSMGRLFDAVAALLGLCQISSREAEAAMSLEASAAGAKTAETYPFHLVKSAAAATVDWTPMIQRMLMDIHGGVEHNLITAGFHNTLVEIIEALAQRTGLPRVVLSGGCFQNRRLSVRSEEALRRTGFNVFRPQRWPCHDSGIAIGQLAVAKARDAAASGNGLHGIQPIGKLSHVPGHSRSSSQRF